MCISLMHTSFMQLTLPSISRFMKLSFIVLTYAVMLILSVCVLTGHTAKVFHVKWSPLKEGLLCSGSDDG